MQDVIQKLLHLLTRVYPGKNGLLPRSIDAKNGAVLSRKAIVDELGDYLPYIFYAARLARDEAAYAWGVEHLRAVLRVCKTTVGYLDTNVTIDQERPRKRKAVYSIHNADTINGLVASFIVCGDGSAEAMTKQFFVDARKKFFRGNFLPYAVHDPYGFSLGVENILATAYTVEEMVRFADAGGSSDVVEVAEAFVRRVTEGSFFKTHGLFPARLYKNGIWKYLLEPLFVTSGRVSSEAAVMVKDNAYMVFALLALYRRTSKPYIRQIIERWKISFLEKAYVADGQFHNIWHPRTGAHSLASLQHSHSIIELFVDIHETLHDPEALTVAKRIAQYWCGKINSATGLALEREGSKEALLDPQVDFAIDLIRLHRLTGEEEYKNKARAMFRGVKEYFSLPNGFAWKVDGTNGRVLQSAIELKYLGLLLKGCIISELEEKTFNLFADKVVRNIARDR